MKKSSLPILTGIVLLIVLLMGLLVTTAHAETNSNGDLTDIYLEVEAPYAGRTACFDAWGAPMDECGYYHYDNNPYRLGNYHDGVRWYDQTADVYLQPGDTFQKGHIYEVAVMVRTTQATRRFITAQAQGSVSIFYVTNGHINGNTGFMGVLNSSYANREAIVYYTFEACPNPPNDISFVGVTDIATPYDGDYAMFTASVTGSNYRLCTDGYDQHYGTRNGVAWHQQLPGDYTYIMDVGTQFTREKVYTVYFLLESNYPYQFSVGSSGNHAMAATVKGYTAEVLPAHDKDPHRYCIVKYTFPASPYYLTKLTGVALEDVPIPAPGRAPIYTAAAGSGFSVEVYEDKYARNGISWYDYTDNRFLQPTDTFLEGHIYSVNMPLVTTEGYVFADDKKGNCLTTVTVNGAAAVAEASSEGPGKIYVEYTFPPCVKQKVTEIVLTDVDAPVAGQRPDVTITTGSDAYGLKDRTDYYYTNGIGWFDVTSGEMVTQEQTFQTGHTYMLEVYLIPTTGYEFAYPSVCTVNGFETDAFGSAGQMYISYTFPPAAAAPVKITTQPKNAAAPNGSTAKVTVKASGDGLTYKWYYKNKGASKFTYTSSFKTNTYSLAMNADRDGRQIYCVVTDAYGNSVKSNTVTLYLGTPVKITSQPKNAAAPNGSSAKVTVKASGEGLTYKWYYKNKGASKFTYTSSFKTNTYSLAMNADRDGRQVYCVITDKYGISVKSNTATLYMGNPAKITAQPKNVTVASGTSAKVTVKATGDGLRYKWYYKDKGASKFSYTSTFKSSSYTVSMTSARSGRQVYCVITDKYGNSVKTNTVTLTEGNPAKITAQPKSVTAKAGTKPTFRVTATGDGLTYQWQVKTSASGSWKNTTTAGCATNTITVSATAARSGYQYRCVVTDKYGNTVYSAAAKLTVN